MPPSDDEQRAARARSHEVAERVEAILAGTETEPKYPVTAEELAEEYADQEIDLPNETESMGDVFDRLSGEYGSEAEVLEAVLHELSGSITGFEYNPERDVEELAEDTPVVGSLRDGGPEDGESEE